MQNRRLTNVRYSSPVRLNIANSLSDHSIPSNHYLLGVLIKSDCDLSMHKDYGT